MRDLSKNAMEARTEQQTRQIANKIEGRKVKEPKLKRSNAEMAASSAVVSPFDALPDELVLKIIKMASWVEPGT